MEKQSLSMYVRTEKGKNASKKLRKDGYIPAVLYGHNKDTVLTKVAPADMKILAKHRGKAVFYVIENGDESLRGKKILVKELVKNPVSDAVLHLDFYELADKEMIKLSVPIRLKGKPKGIANGGIVEWEKREVEIKAFLEEIPDFIEVDISNLDITESIHLSQIPMPKNVQLIDNGIISVVTIVPPKQVTELTDEEKKAQLEASLGPKETAATAAAPAAAGKPAKESK
jgi:large subunit ribosomal protein L25